MKRKFTTVSGITAMAAVVLSCAGMAQASVTVDFDAVNLRAANDGSGYGTIVEWANQNGVTANNPKPGQKVYYGTDAFNGWNVSDIDYLEFTYK